MAAFKYTFLFDWQQRAGWSETFYKETGSGTGEATALARAWGTNRQKVLTAAATILAARITPTNDPRNTTLFPLGLKGALGQGIIVDNIQPDVVNVAQLSTLTASTGQKRQYLIRGLDDRDVVDGQITYAQNGVAIMNRWLNFLVSSAWQMRDYIPGVPAAVNLVDGVSGIVTGGAIAGIAVNDIVVMNTRTTGGGKKVHWQGRVKEVGVGQITLRNYKFGDAAGGQIVKVVASYPAFTQHFEPIPNWARTRQTGRPFNLPRGRAPKRT